MTVGDVDGGGDTVDVTRLLAPHTYAGAHAPALTVGTNAMRLSAEVGGPGWPTVVTDVPGEVECGS